MTRYTCVESRRIADDVYVAGELYEIADGRAERYSSYFSRIDEAPKATPRASKSKVRTTP